MMRLLVMFPFFSSSEKTSLLQLSNILESNLWSHLRYCNVVEISPGTIYNTNKEKAVIHCIHCIDDSKFNRMDKVVKGDRNACCSWCAIQWLV